MKIKFLFFISFLILSMIISSCSGDEPKKQEEPVITKIAILHTNDTHGSLWYLPKLKTIADNLRLEVDNVFILSAGDIFSGSPYTDVYEKQGFPMIDLMNDAGYDLAVIGNHDFDYGQETLKERMLDAKFPFILANIEKATPAVKDVKPYAILKAKNNINLAVLGLLDKYPATALYNITDIEFSDPKETIKDYLHLSKDNTLVVLSHLGHEDDLELAKDNPEIKLIVGGHSHSTIYEPDLINNALVVQAGGNGSFVGEVILTFKDNVLIEKTGRLIIIDGSIESDAELKEKLDVYYDNPFLTEIIGQAGEGFYDKFVIANLMSDSYKSELNTEFAMMKRSGVRNDYIGKGSISRKDVYTFDPFNNTLLTVDIKADELLEILKYNLRNNETELSVNISGFKLLLKQENCNADKIGDIVEYSLISNGLPLDKDKAYHIGMTKHLYDKLTLLDDSTMLVSEKTTAESTINYIQEQETIFPDHESDIVRVCEDDI